MLEIEWTIGVEAELLAPRGLSRRDLAERLAGPGGSVRPYFLPQSEPSQVEGMETFHNLTLAFEAIGADGQPIARCADDLTLQSDLLRRAPPEPGWFRVVSDDMRLLRLAQRHCRADAGMRGAIEGLADLFGTELTAAGGMLRAVDAGGASVAIAAPLPGERHRPCELITPPIAADHAARLEALLGPARAMGFSLAAESATHLHFDGAALQDARVLRNLVRLLQTHGETCKRLVGVNPRCRRLGAWPEALFECVEAEDFPALPWPEAQRRLKGAGLSKYCDYNLVNLALDLPHKRTFEVRVLPGLIDAAPILWAAALFEGLLRRALDPAPVGWAPAYPWGVGGAGLAAVEGLLGVLVTSDEVRGYWRERGARIGG